MGANDKQRAGAAGAPIIVAGLGDTGLSCARHLARCGERFVVVDDRKAPPQLDAFCAEFPDVELHLGRYDTALLESAREVVLSPGLSLAAQRFRRARRAGVSFIGDIELFARHATAPIVAVTGSNGKSTVTTLIGLMGVEAGVDVAVGGNLGPPALDLLERDPPELFVLELSSFQLETTHSLAASVAAVLNVSADHMDRYADVSAYAGAKARIFHGDGAMVINLDDALVASMATPERDVTGFTISTPGAGDFGVRIVNGEDWLCQGREPLMLASELRVPGRHNVANALAALAIGTKAGFATPAMLRALRRFEGLAHRCQRVASNDGVRWYNDSKGTNVGATAAAIEGLSDAAGSLVLILGGQGKGADFAALRAPVRAHVGLVVTLGVDAPAIESALADTVPIARAADLGDAVARAKQQARAGDIVLFSPACASFDMFESYSARGDAFIALVRQMCAQDAP